MTQHPDKYLLTTCQILNLLLPEFIRNSNWDSQNSGKGLTQSAVKVKGRGEGNRLQIFGYRLCTGSQHAGRATANCCTENKHLLTAQPLACQGGVYPGSKLLVTSCATPLPRDSLLCFQIWNPQLIGVLFCHNPWVFKGIANHACCWQHSLQVDPSFEHCLSVTKLLASAIPN